MRQFIKERFSHRPIASISRVEGVPRIVHEKDIDISDPSRQLSDEEHLDDELLYRSIDAKYRSCTIAARMTPKMAYLSMKGFGSSVRRN